MSIQVITPRRVKCAWVTKRNKAWFVAGVDRTGEEAPDDLFSCAGALTVAQREAVRIARSQGYEGAVRWNAAEFGSPHWGEQWILTMTDPGY